MPTENLRKGMGSGMVDKVSNQKYYEYSKINQQRRETTGSSEFNLNLGDQGVIYEKSSQKKSEKAKEAAAKGDAQKSGAYARAGVQVEISRQGHKKTGTKQQGASLVEGVQKYVAIAVGFLKSLWNKIWNDSPAAGKENFPEILEDKLTEKDATPFFGGMDAQEIQEIAVGAPEGGESFFGGMDAQKAQKSAKGAPEEPAYTQEEIRRIFRRGNRQEIEDFLSNHGKRRLAKNTELLTQYDRRGSIVGIDHAEKELILFGNKNEIRL